MDPARHEGNQLGSALHRPQGFSAWCPAFRFGGPHVGARCWSTVGAPSPRRRAVRNRGLGDAGRGGGGCVCGSRRSASRQKGRSSPQQQRAAPKVGIRTRRMSTNRPVTKLRTPVVRVAPPAIELQNEASLDALDESPGPFRNGRPFWMRIELSGWMRTGLLQSKPTASWRSSVQVHLTGSDGRSERPRSRLCAPFCGVVMGFESRCRNSSPVSIDAPPHSPPPP